MHYYQFNIADYRKDTAHLSLLEHGVYRQLLDTYYLSESPIPRETQQVIRRLCARTQEEQSAIEIVLNEFFLLTDEGWIHKRCDAEIEEYKKKAENSRTNGRKGGRPKSMPEPEKTQRVILANPEESQMNLNSLTKELNNSLTHIIPTKKIKSIPSLVPEKFEVSPEMFEWAIEQGVPEDKVRFETEQFIDRNKSNGNKYSDWKAAWRTWIRNSVKFSQRKFS